MVDEDIADRYLLFVCDEDNALELWPKLKWAPPPPLLTGKITMISRNFHEYPWTNVSIRKLFVSGICFYWLIGSHCVTWPLLNRMSNHKIKSELKLKDSKYSFQIVTLDNFKFQIPNSLIEINYKLTFCDLNWNSILLKVNNRCWHCWETLPNRTLQHRRFQHYHLIQVTWS